MYKIDNDYSDLKRAKIYFEQQQKRHYDDKPDKTAIKGFYYLEGDFHDDAVKMLWQLDKEMSTQYNEISGTLK